MEFHEFQWIIDLIMSSELAGYSTEALLDYRMCDLGLSLRRSPVTSLIQIFRQELTSRGLQKLRPAVYLGDEWFSPRGVNAIAVPFYLANPRLMELEREMMTMVEGEGRDWFLRLMRHEAGHCFDHAYKLSNRREWQDIFGDPEVEYRPDHYRPKPFTRKHVKNLDGHYAQAHPIEDFAETFAIWMRDPAKWATRHRNYPVILRKLQYVESVVRRYGNRKPISGESSRMCAAGRLRVTLREHYQRRINAEGPRYGKIMDSDLRDVFVTPSSSQRRAFPWRAADIDALAAEACRLTGIRKYRVRQELNVLRNRSEQLGLVVPKLSAHVRKKIVSLATRSIQRKDGIATNDRDIKVDGSSQCGGSRS